MHSAATLAKPVVYPESDGKPMGETEVHVKELMAVCSILDNRYQDDASIYVGANMFCYYVEGMPSKCFCPDVFVVFGIPRKVRRTYRIWEELKPPTVIIEITSKESKHDDVGTKKTLYAELGVEEYFVYDPLREYLRPPLQGFVLKRGAYEELPVAPDGSLVSKRLGLRMQLKGSLLELWDVATGKRLLRHSEEFLLRREAEQREREAVDREREAVDRERGAEQRAIEEQRRRQAAEAEVEKLRRQLARRAKKRSK